MTATKHTPTPWKHTGRIDAIIGADGVEVCTLALYGYHLPPIAKDNAEYLCRAVNAHDELVAALESIATMRDDMPETTHAYAKNLARAALAKAGS